MARPIWSGVLSFGLVTVPVSLYSATESHTVGFRQIQRGTADRVRNKRVNERTGEEVPYSEIVKGFEVAEGEYVVIEPEELDRISPGRSKMIEINGFVDLAEVDPIFFDTTYYLGPKGKEYTKVYNLLMAALERSNKAGLAMFAMRGREYLTAIRAEGGLLVAHTMHFADEVRDPRHEIDNLPEAGAEPADRELKAAEQLIDMLAVDWHPEDYRDDFEEKVHQLIAAKQAGEEVAVAAEPSRPSNVVDLMDVLTRSLESARSGSAGGGPAEPDQEGREGQEGQEGRETREEQPGRARSSARSAQRRPKATGEKKSTSAAARERAGATGAGTGAGTKKRTTAGGTGAKEDLSALTKGELYKRATELDIPHRSTMTRDELQQALERKGRRHLRAAS
ncbi:Ku protein [Kitasatospora sp. NPDC050543]|uniref:non-homologous end joining protein Ku n=1 Tax=Kitasatospora sp. NPDC050543 TaxID=3364054 RepID=UPI003792DE29